MNPYSIDFNVPLGNTVTTAVFCIKISTPLAMAKVMYCSLILLIRPNMPPAVMTSSPFANEPIKFCCSLARLFCGRQIAKYTKRKKITNIGINDIKPPGGGGFAAAVAASACALSMKKFKTVDMQMEDVEKIKQELAERLQKEINEGLTDIEELEGEVNTIKN